MYQGQLAAIGVAQAVGPHQPRALRRAMLVRDQLAVDAEHAAQAGGAQGQGFDGELHGQVAAMVEEGVADALDFFQLFQHVAAYQVAAEAVGVQGVEVVFEEHVQVLIVELLQAPLWAEEGFEVFQRSVLAAGLERVAACQTVAVEAVDFAVPAFFQFAQGGDYQNL